MAKSKKSENNQLGSQTHKTERSGVAVIMAWMREIIEKHNLDLGLPDVEMSGTDRKMPDLEINESRRSQQVLCLLEAKPPYFDVFDEEELKEPARKKANHRGAKYFVLLNFKKMIWFSTEKANQPQLKEEEQIVAKYNLGEIQNLNDLEQTRYSEPIKRRLEEFLLKLYAVHTGKEAEPRIAIDDFLVTRLQEKIGLLAYYYRSIIENKAQNDANFLQSLKNWFADQNWNFAGASEDYDKAARQTAYLLVNKILFYDLVQAKRPAELDPLEIPAGLTKGSMLEVQLQGYFSQILKIDYESIFSTDFVDSLAFPDAREVVEEIKKLVAILNRYDFSTLGFDIIGRIFERLIPSGERHNFGQYFTSADVVDLILKFCLRHENEKVLDPSCGAGTFLVRAYQHKKLMNQRQSHEDVLDSLWGNDIAKFPASLAIINLAINDLASDTNYPNIIQEDFFEIQKGKDGIDLEDWRKRMTKTLRGREREIVYPREFDAIVGNPPYTRQEEISEIAPDIAQYKQQLIENALKVGTNKIAELSKRAGLHAYFFVHGWKFLKEGGRFGFIVSNSWLDADYGRGLQEFFLKNYKIIAIIESKVERWFEQADVNTSIIILEKCSDADKRDQNQVRFVYLKKELRHFVPPTGDIWEQQIERLNALDSLRKTILAHGDIYENDEMRIFPRTQAELWTEGFDEEKRRYVGAKWGKYLRAPEIFFTILQKAKNKLVPLKQIAKVRFGIKTGANEFFYLSEAEIKQKGIEDEFWTHTDKHGEKIPNKIILRAREAEKPTIEANDLAFNVLLIRDKREELEGTNLLKYLEKGEENNYNQRETCASRKNWFNVGTNINDEIAFPQRFRERHMILFNPQKVSLNKNLYGVKPLKGTNSTSLAKILNSTFILFCLEIFARQPGGGGGPLDVDVKVAAEVLVPQIKEIKQFQKRIEKIKILERKIENIFKELGANSPDEVSLEKVKPDRFELDKIILQDILGLSEAEHSEVYREVVDLVRSRLDKAQSFGKQTKKKDVTVTEAFSHNLVDDFDNGG